jgi:nitroreductase
MLLSLLETRRSIRKYLPQPVEREKLDQILEAGLRAPSSRGLNPWELIVVDQPELLKKLAAAKAHGAEFLKDAPLAVVVCADPDRCDVWIEDASIVAALLMLTAHDLGLGSCWVQYRLRRYDQTLSATERLRDPLGLPESLQVLCAVAIGYPAERQPGHSREKLPWAKLHHNRFEENN